MTLNHTIVPSYKHEETAKFYEKIFGFTFVKIWGHFAVVKVNSTLTLDFVVREDFDKVHLAFKVSEKEFKEILERLERDNIVFGSGPYAINDGEINHNDGGLGLYFKDPNEHVLEILTKDYDLT